MLFIVNNLSHCISSKYSIYIICSDFPIPKIHAMKRKCIWFPITQNERKPLKLLCFEVN